MHVESVHEGKKPFKCDISYTQQKYTIQFMKERSHSNVTFVSTAALTKAQQKYGGETKN